MAAAVGKLTECSICFDELTDPRFLPCLHTFCFRCIKGLRFSHHKPGVPCPLCRTLFNESAASLRKNDYAEELVSLNRDAEETAREREMLNDELETVRTLLGESESALLEAGDERRRQDVALAETRSKLLETEDRSSQLGSRVKGLERNLADAKSRQRCLREQQQETTGKLLDAERRCEAARCEVETWKTAKNESEESLAKAKESRRNLHKRLQQIQEESGQQIRDANLEAESCQIAKNNVEKSLAKAKEKCRALRQQNSHFQRESREDAKLLETELFQSKQDTVRLEKLLEMERMKHEQCDDYKQSHAEGSQIRNLFHDYFCARISSIASIMVYGSYTTVDAVNITVHTFAAECRAAAPLLLHSRTCRWCTRRQRRQLLIDISCRQGAQQQTRRPSLQLLSNDGTYGRTDGRPIVTQTLFRILFGQCQ